MTPARRIVFIAALERSGSTVLDRVLGLHPRLVSLGEAERVILPHGAPLDSVLERPCTCGQTVSKCRFWSRVVAAIRERGSDSLAARYAAMLDVFGEVFGAERMPIDSSKSLRAMEALARVPGAEVSVLLAIRDVRGWMTSIKAAEARKAEMTWGRAFQPGFRMFWLSYIRHMILRRVPLWLPWEWMLRNARLMQRARRLFARTHRVGHEPLVFDTQRVTDGVFEFLGLPKVTLGSGAAVEPPHIVRGNRMAFSEGPLLPLKYDFAWMRSYRANALPVVLAPVFWKNARWVYGDTRTM